MQVPEIVSGADNRACFLVKSAHKASKVHVVNNDTAGSHLQKGMEELDPAVEIDRRHSQTIE